MVYEGSDDVWRGRHFQCIAIHFAIVIMQYKLVLISAQYGKIVCFK